ARVGVARGGGGCSGQMGAEVAGDRKAPPLVGDHNGTVLTRDLDRAVGRLSVHNDDRPGFFPHRRFHARREQPFGVAHRYDNRQVRELDVVADDAHDPLSAGTPSGVVTAASCSTMTSEAWSASYATGT